VQAATHPEHPNKWPTAPLSQPKILKKRGLETAEELQPAKTKYIKQLKFQKSV
jgi:hypothetical protein